jgi:hypothetical protein
MHRVSDIRHIDMHTAEPLVPGPSHLGDEKLPLQSWKNTNHQVVTKFRQNWFKQEEKTFVFLGHKLSNYVRNKKELHDQWKESIIEPT